eukprot:6462241-Amphidinium_carterae.1
MVRRCFPDVCVASDFACAPGDILVLRGEGFDAEEVEEELYLTKKMLSTEELKKRCARSSNWPEFGYDTDLRKYATHTSTTLERPQG